MPQIDTLMAIALGAIVIIGSLILGSGSTEKVQASTIAKHIITSADNIKLRSFKTPTAVKYAGITPGNLAATLVKSLADATNTAGTQIDLDWGATVLIEPASSTGGTGNSNLLISVLNQGRAECDMMLQEFSGVVPVIFSGSSGTTQVQNLASNDPLTPVEMSTVCSSDDTTNSFRLLW